MRVLKSMTPAGEECEIAVSYLGVTVSLDGESPVTSSAPEIRYNTAFQVRIHDVLEQLGNRQITAAEGLTLLQRLEHDTPRHPAWLAVTMLGTAAAALASLLGADVGAIVIAGLATGIGLIARKLLSRGHATGLALPFVAALIGGVIGGIAIRQGWTTSPGLALIVPCLMLVPGPHLINGLLDLVDNQLPMSMARPALATAILVAAGLGLLIGVELSISSLPELRQSFVTDQPSLLVDMFLAGIVTAGFSVYYNTSWPLVGLTIVGGAIGHGLRSLAIRADWSLEAATFLGGFAVGAVSTWLARSSKAPVAVIAFAGAVTMMPGLQIYGALRGVVQLARLQQGAELPTITAMLANGAESVAVVAALGLGLIVSTRLLQIFPRVDRSLPR